MKLYMKQKVFSFRDRFTIKNEYGEDKYYIEGEIFSFGKKLRIYDIGGNELAFVNQKVLSFVPKFTIEAGGRVIGEIVKKVTFLRPRYIVNGLGWEIEGDFFSHNYDITEDGRSIVSIHKQWMSWGDTFELDIANDNDNDAVIALAVVLAIDAVMDAANQ